MVDFAGPENGGWKNNKSWKMEEAEDEESAHVTGLQIHNYT